MPTTSMGVPLQQLCCSLLYSVYRCLHVCQQHTKHVSLQIIHWARNDAVVQCSFTRVCQVVSNNMLGAHYLSAVTYHHSKHVTCIVIRLFANDVSVIGSVRADWPAPFSVTIGNPRADKLGRNGFECIGRSVVAAVIRGHTRMLSATFWGYQGIRRMLSAFTKKYDYFVGHCRSNIYIFIHTRPSGSNDIAYCT